MVPTEQSAAPFLILFLVRRRRDCSAPHPHLITPFNKLRCVPRFLARFKPEFRNSNRQSDARSWSRNESKKSRYTQSGLSRFFNSFMPKRLCQTAGFNFGFRVKGPLHIRLSSAEAWQPPSPFRKRSTSEKPTKLWVDPFTRNSCRSRSSLKTSSRRSPRLRTW